MLISFFLNNSVSSFNNNKILIVRLLNDYIISNYLIVETNILLSFFFKILHLSFFISCFCLLGKFFYFCFILLLFTIYFVINPQRAFIHSIRTIVMEQYVNRAKCKSLREFSRNHRAI